VTASTHFDAFFRSLPEPYLLIDTKGNVLAGNAAASRIVPGLADGANGPRLEDVVEDAPERIESYLKECSRSGSPLPGSLTLSAPRNGESRLRCYGAAVALPGETRQRLVLLHLAPARSSSREFLLLNEKIADLTRESRRRRQAEEALRTGERRALFLAEASRVLGESLDYEETLRNVASMAVPAMADWCAVDLVDPDGTIRRVAVTHPDPARVELAIQLQERYPTDPEAGYGVPSVVRSGRAEMIAEIPEQLLIEVAQDEQHLRILKDLGLRSYLVAPLLHGAKAFGGITFVFAESGRTYTEEDLVIAEDLARRAGTAIENARLVADIEESREQMEHQALELELQATELQSQAAALEEQTEELKAAAGRLRKADDEKAALLESTGDGIYGLDADGRCTFLNRAGAALLGYSPDEVLGREMHSIIHHHREDGSPYPLEECPLLQVLRTGQGIHVDGEVLWTKDGSVIPVEYSSFPILEGSEVRGAVVGFRDVGQRRRAEEERERLIEELAAASQSKSGFIATMSHELRTPLNALIGYAQLLEMGVPEPIPAAARAQVERIRMAAVYQLSLIEEILTFSRLDAGREDLEISRLSPRELLAEVHAIIEPLAAAKGLSFVMKHDGAPGKIETDARKLRQILLNLLGNAVKFTDDGEVAIEVRGEGSEVLFEVRDTGPGIAREDVGRLFEPFWQADQSHTRRSEGTGLGLAIAEQFVRLLGGSITVESPAAGGAVFRVRLPDQAPLPSRSSSPVAGTEAER
jgi:PAS domain S-box-containing protein